MTTPQKVVAVTGSSGHLGAKLMEHLEDAPWLAKLMAFDLLPLGAPVHNIAAFRKDVSLPISEELIRHRASAVVHLAFEWRSGMRRRERKARSVPALHESGKVAGADDPPDDGGRPNHLVTGFRRSVHHWCILRRRHPARLIEAPSPRRSSQLLLQDTPGSVDVPIVRTTVDLPTVVE